MTFFILFYLLLGILRSLETMSWYSKVSKGNGNFKGKGKGKGPSPYKSSNYIIRVIIALKIL